METNLLTLDKTRLSLVDPIKLKEVFEKLKIKTKPSVDDTDELIFLSGDDLKDNKQARCEGCGNRMTIKNFGHLVHGSNLIYCKNPHCFTHYIANRKLR